MLSTKASHVCLSVAVGLVLTGCGGSSSGPNNANVTLTGAYGGTSADTSRTPATLQLTATGGQLTLPCNVTDQFNQPLVTDANGRFSIAGTSTYPVLGVPVGLPSPVPKPVVLSGTANGDTITLTVTDTATHQALGTYTVVKGRSAPPMDGGCVA